MGKGNPFDKLFIFEMANNHMGDVEHGIRVIREFGEAAKEFDFNFAFKLQYRDLDTFIHPDFRERMDIKYVKRFSETRLSEQDFLKLKEEMGKNGFRAICTPFDEASVGKIEEHGFDMLKIASCSFTDWPLLERIAQTKLPIIASTAGASLESIDAVVSFLEHRDKEFALMHCVGEYPTRKENLQLNQIRFLRERYPEITVGYSTHESPDETDAVKIAIGEGARIFERHVGIKTEKYGINGYSSTPEQAKKWLESAKEAYVIAGIGGEKTEVTQKEKEDLRGLQRGVFAKAPLKAGERLTTENTFLAIPNEKGQMVANDLSKYSEFTLKADVGENGAVMLENTEEQNHRELVAKYLSQVKKVLKDSNLALPRKVEMEFSHHYGLEKFGEWGATIISVVNREYCKKLIILLPGQRHPPHAHKIKEEAFQVLYGSVYIDLGDGEKEYKAGDLLVVERGKVHSFRSDTGTIFEEVSTTHHKGDSYYKDESILANPKRKTVITCWIG